MDEQTITSAETTDYDPAPVYLDEAEAPETAEDAPDALDEASAEDELERSWFFIHCYSGYEKKVEHALRQRIETMGMQDLIYDVLIPTEDEIEVKDGKRRTVEKRVFPGYVMVQMRWMKICPRCRKSAIIEVSAPAEADEEAQMEWRCDTTSGGCGHVITEEDVEEMESGWERELDKDAWYTVRNTPGVVGFVGGESQPTPLRPEEVKRIMDRMDSEDKVVKVDYKIGERVRIVGGPFNDFPGTVASIDSGREKVRVMVDFFGRETAVVLSFMEVERM